MTTRLLIALAACAALAGCTTTGPGGARAAAEPSRGEAAAPDAAAFLGYHGPLHRMGNRGEE